jgi:DNA-binding MarR family transcriptional regulator
VKLTPGGTRILQRNRSVRTAFVAARLKRLPAEERAHLEELVGLLEQLVDQK